MHVWHIFLFVSFLSFFFYVLCALMFYLHIDVCLCQIPCNWSYRQLCATMWVLGINPGSSRSAPSVLTH